MIKLLYISVTAIMFIFMLWMVFWWIPIDISQGPVANCIYSCPTSLVLYGCNYFSIYCLNNLSCEKKSFWDQVAQSTAEIGVIFGIAALVSGIIWAKPIWGVWWTGEAKLTTTLI